jgi:hypothetical protein
MIATLEQTDHIHYEYITLQIKQLNAVEEEYRRKLPRALLDRGLAGTWKLLTIDKQAGYYELEYRKDPLSGFSATVMHETLGVQGTLADIVDYIKSLQKMRGTYIP